MARRYKYRQGRQEMCEGRYSRKYNAAVGRRPRNSGRSAQAQQKSVQRNANKA